MKFKIFYGLFVFTSFLLLSSFSSAQNLKSESNKEKILFTNIKYLDTIQNTKPAAGIPEVDVDYWMKTVFKGMKDVKEGKGYVEFEDTLCNDYLKFKNLKPEKTKNKISISKVYYCDKSNQKLAYLFFLSSKEFTTCVLESQMLNEAKFYEYENTEISIIELQFKENKWIFKNLTYNLRNCLSEENYRQSETPMGWVFALYPPKLLSLESGHHFIITDIKEKHFYFQNIDTCKIFSIGNFETPSIGWESLNEFEYSDTSFLNTTKENYLVTFRNLKPYKKTENTKFFLDKGILYAEITQDGFIHDREKDKMIPQNAKTYYRYSEEKKIFTKLE